MAFLREARQARQGSAGSLARTHHRSVSHPTEPAHPPPTGRRFGSPEMPLETGVPAFRWAGTPVRRRCVARCRSRLGIDRYGTEESCKPCRMTRPLPRRSASPTICPASSALHPHQRPVKTCRKPWEQQPFGHWIDRLVPRGQHSSCYPNPRDNHNDIVGGSHRYRSLVTHPYFFLFRDRLVYALHHNGHPGRA